MSPKDVRATHGERSLRTTESAPGVFSADVGNCEARRVERRVRGDNPGYRMQNVKV